jgi:type IV pilus assembly protein PilC
MPSIDVSRYQKKKPATAKVEGTDVFAFLNKDISFGSKQVSDKKKESLYVSTCGLPWS